jgi:hypothetical protein
VALQTSLVPRAYRVCVCQTRCELGCGDEQGKSNKREALWVGDDSTCIRALERRLEVLLMFETAATPFFGRVCQHG